MTGVQTCALPICHERDVQIWRVYVIHWRFVRQAATHRLTNPSPVPLKIHSKYFLFQYIHQIQEPGTYPVQLGKTDIYPVKERKQYDFQLVPDILIIDMEVVLWVGEVSTDLQRAQ